MSVMTKPSGQHQWIILAVIELDALFIAVKSPKCLTLSGEILNVDECVTVGWRDAIE